MLHKALAVCYASRFGDLQSALRDGVDAMDFYTEPQLGTALACLASDMGISSEERDLALCAALTKTNLAGDKEILNLFPAAAAALFVSDKWEKAHYLPRLEAFDNNEHCIQVALVKLFSCFFTLYSSNLGQEQHDPAESTGSVASVEEQNELGEVKKVAKRLVVRENYKHYVERYLRIASQTLLVQREGEVHKKASAQAPHRCMSLMLEYFTSMCATVEPGSLERYLPNYLVHADRMDVSLGKQKTADALRAFTHAAAASAQQEGQEQY